MIKWVGFVGISISILLCSCDVTEKVYGSFSDIKENDGVKSWLPDFFPESAVNINITSNVDLNYFGVYFSLPSHDGRLLLNTEEDVTIEGMFFLKQQVNNIIHAACISSNYNKFGDKRHGYFMVGRLKENGKYYLTNVTDEQYKLFCQKNS